MDRRSEGSRASRQSNGQEPGQEDGSSDFGCFGRKHGVLLYGETKMRERDERMQRACRKGTVFNHGGTLFICPILVIPRSMCRRKEENGGSELGQNDGGSELGRLDGGSELN
jgi:hypothetical protein